MNIRTESVVFSELEALCSRPGYVHALALIVVSDAMYKSNKNEITKEDFLKMTSGPWLAKREINLLIGLTFKNGINVESLEEKQVIAYFTKTYDLFEELHVSIRQNENSKVDNLLREAIYYGGEPAYDFQYRDFSIKRYEKDDDWLLRNKGFSISQAKDIFKCIQEILHEKINDQLNNRGEPPQKDLSYFSSFVFSIEDIKQRLFPSINLESLHAVIDSFTTPEKSFDINAMDDYNPTDFYPLIKINEQEYLVFFVGNLFRSLYESPFVWFNDGKRYEINKNASKHRGFFTEQITSERLIDVFGEKHVFKNITLMKGRDTLGEIDVLVSYADRAIICQAKSKKLTLLARQGDCKSIETDFNQAVQEAYNQAFSCAELLIDPDNRLLDSEGEEISINRDYSEIYPFCIVAGHYPSLSFQARLFLQYIKEHDYIKPPFVMDVFFLDVLAEMLCEPIKFLFYVNRRTTYDVSIHAAQELTVLGYHLTENLWMDDDRTIFSLAEDLCTDLDIAMWARREGFPGKNTPEGILTDYIGTPFERLMRELESIESSPAISLGVLLYTFDESMIDRFNEGMEYIIRRHKEDARRHTFSLQVKELASGISLHCNEMPLQNSKMVLLNHCLLRKYEDKAFTWFGVCIEKNGRVRLVVEERFPWEKNTLMEKQVKCLRKSKPPGRNNKCPCGSGKKYKKCCGKKS